MLYDTDFGAKFDISVGDELCFAPYPNIWYTVHQFNVFADPNMILVLDGTDTISKDVRNVVGHRFPVKQMPVKRERGKRLAASTQPKDRS